MSLHGLLAGVASSNMFRMFADPDVYVTYQDKEQTVSDLPAVVEALTTSMEVDDRGREILITHAGLLLSRLEYGWPRGVPNPQSRGVTFKFRGGDFDGQEWSLRLDAGGIEPIEYQTEHLTKFNIISSRFVATRNQEGRRT